MKIFIDTEFDDDGRTTELISIALVAEDGREFYAVNGDCNWDRLLLNGWVMDNVVRKHLPRKKTRDDWNWQPDLADPVYLTREAIATEVEAFLAATPDPETWAYYSATDHVVLYQLFGPMIVANRWHGVPMRTSCLKQEEETLRRIKGHYLSDRPVQDPATEHHALHDARHDMELGRWLGLIA